MKFQKLKRCGIAVSVLFLTSICVSSCHFGDVSKNNQLIGQVKKIENVTPLFLPSYTRVDLSLGVTSNGSGSISKEDMWFYVPNGDLVKQLQAANEHGSVVNLQYSTARFRWYVEHPYVTYVEETK